MTLLATEPVVVALDEDVRAEALRLLMAAAKASSLRVTSAGLTGGDDEGASIHTMRFFFAGADVFVVVLAVDLAVDFAAVALDAGGVFFSVEVVAGGSVVSFAAVVDASPAFSSDGDFFVPFFFVSGLVATSEDAGREALSEGIVAAAREDMA